MCVSPAEHTDGRGEGSLIIRQRESLVLYKSFNTLCMQVKANGRVLNLGGKCSVPVEPGDMFCLQTPGGGGWGKKASSIPIASLVAILRIRIYPRFSFILTSGSTRSNDVG
jgi:hypothetical protein